MKHMIIGWLAAIVGLRFSKCVPMANAWGAGTHEDGKVTRKCDAVLAQADLLVKAGSDADHVAVTAADTDKPRGFTFAATDAIEDDVGVTLLGKGAGTKLAVADAAIADDAELVPAAAGKVKTLPGDAGTYWVIGSAVGAADAGDDPIEVNDCKPFQVVVSE